MNRTALRFANSALVAIALTACTGTTTPSDVVDADATAIDIVDRTTSDAPIDIVDTTTPDAIDIVDTTVTDSQDTSVTDTNATDVPVDAAPDVTPADVIATDANDVISGRVPMNHRPDDAACAGTAPPGNCSFGGGAGICSMDSDCTSGTNGRCVMNNGGAVFCRCSYDECTHDGDCATGQLCACHGSAYLSGGNTCIPGDCRVDSDCGAGGYCSPTHGTAGCGGVTGYYCHTASDTCIDDSDCTGSGSGPMVCAYSTTNHRWQCDVQLLCP